MNASEHIKAAELLVQRTAERRLPVAAQVPYLLQALVHGLLAVALHDDGSLSGTTDRTTEGG